MATKPTTYVYVLLQETSPATFLAELNRYGALGYSVCGGQITVLPFAGLPGGVGLTYVALMELPT